MTTAEELDALAGRLWARVDKNGPGGCWLWTGARTKGGYGEIYGGRVNGRRTVRYVHRLAWELLVGPIPEGLTLDHVRARGCEHRHCCNPAHLEPVTIGENARRGGNAQKTHCANGHELKPGNLYVRANGHRRCRTCVLGQQKEARA